MTPSAPGARRRSFLVPRAAACLLGLVAGCGGAEKPAPPEAAPPAPAAGARPERGAGGGRAVAEGPNVLLLCIDTLRRDALRVYAEDAPEQPHLAAFAAGAAVFDGAISPASWTLPAQASLLTGLYPDEHGATSSARRLPAEVPTLAEALRRRGYHTAGLTDGGFLHPSFGLAQGFDRYDKVGRNRKFIRMQKQLPRGGGRAAMPGANLFDRAVAFFDTRPDPDQPFFLFLQTYAVHDYYQVHPWAAAAVGADGLAGAEHYHDCTLDVGAAADGDWDHLRDLYRAEVTHLDEGFGRLLDALRDHGLLDDTLIVLVSDHGEGFAPERGRIHHAGRLHEDLLRVPLLVRGPGVTARRIAAPVSLVDVMPTLLEWTGAEGPAGLPGLSLAPLLRGGDPPPPRFLFALEHHQYWQDGKRLTVDPPRDTPLLVAVLREDWWYVRGQDGAEELYRMGEDPLQEHPLPVADRPGEALREQAAARAERVAAGAAREIDPEAEADLRKLGYGAR